MTIPSTPRKAGPFAGNGATTSFPFAFKVFAPADVKVVVANSAGVETVLALNSDYSVSLNANQDTSPGGVVTYPLRGSPLPSGSVLSIIGNISYDQPLDLPSGGNFSPLALENQLDRTTMQIQQLREEMDRTAKLSPTSSESVEDLVDDLRRIADSADNLDTVAGSITDVVTVGANIANVNVVGANISRVNAVGANIAAVVTVANDLNEPVSEIDTVATNIANVNTVASSIANVNTVAPNIANVNTVAPNIANVNAVGANISRVNAVGANIADVNAVGANIANVNAVGANISHVNAVAANLADVTNYSDTYLGPKATIPTTRNDGSALRDGDLYFSTTTNTLYVYDGTAWSGVSSSNIGPASETAAGIVELATAAEVQEGTDTIRAVTPAGLAAAGAPKLRTARTLTIGNTGKSFDGSADVSWTLADIGAPSTGGTGATGTWGISVSGNAATATKLQTACTITVGNTGKSFDGSANVSWSLAEIGAAGYGILAGNANLNDAVNVGFYRLGPAPVNAPPGVMYGQLIVARGGGDTILQITTGYNNGEIYWRQGNPPSIGGSGVFGPWRRFWHEGNTTSSAGPSGWSVLPGGVIIQWGRLNLVNPPNDYFGTAYFPLAFPNNIFQVSTTLYSYNGNAFDTGVAVTAHRLSGFDFTVQEWGSVNQNVDVTYIAIGN